MSSRRSDASEPDAEGGGDLDLLVAPQGEAALPPRGSPSAALLAHNAPRSEHDPELGAAGIAEIVLHPVTGAFADPLHELAFGAQFYRLAFPFHAFLMGGTIVLCALAIRAPPLDALPELRVSLGFVLLFLALGMAGRIWLHRSLDSARSQRIGARAWTCLIILMGVWICWHSLDIIRLCPATQEDRIAGIASLAFALVNGTHGMAFLRKCTLQGLMISYNLLELALCNKISQPFIRTAPLNSIAAHICSAVVTHLGEMHLRYSYVEKRRLGETLDEDKRRLEERNEQLRAEKERLMYDVQRRTGRPLDDDDGRSAICRGLKGEPSSTLGKAETSLRKITQIFYHIEDDSGGSSDTRSLGLPSGSPPPSLPPGPPSTAGSAELLTKTNKSSKSSEPDHDHAPSHGQKNFSDTENVMPGGHFFAGQTAAGVVLLCEMKVVASGGTRCIWVDLGSEERMLLMEALHASRCDQYFHWNATLARPRVVGRHGMPVVLKTYLLTEAKKGAELVARIEGSEHRLLGVVAEGKGVALQALAAWIRRSDEEATVPLPPHVIQRLASSGDSAAAAAAAAAAAPAALAAATALAALAAAPAAAAAAASSSSDNNQRRADRKRAASEDDPETSSTTTMTPP